MKAQAYHDLKKRHEQELNDFPIAYAFNDTQLQEALDKLGAERSEVCTVLQIGDIVKKTDADALIKLLLRHTKELHALLRSDEKLAEEIFEYEMDNHEYAINYDGDGDVMRCLSLSDGQIKKMGLEQAYARAQRSHFKHMEDWGVI